MAVNALVGGMLGQERTVVPLLAEREFGLTAYTGALTFILAFGATKAATNYLAGTLSDRYGRKPVLIVGWLIGLPVPLLLIWAPSWGWVVAANVLLGINQGLTWSTTVIMKIDLVSPARRGLAIGCNEAAGYLAFAGRRVKRREHADLCHPGVEVLTSAHPQSVGCLPAVARRRVRRPRCDGAAGGAVLLEAADKVLSSGLRGGVGVDDRAFVAGGLGIAFAALGVPRLSASTWRSCLAGLVRGRAAM